MALAIVFAYWSGHQRHLPLWVIPCIAVGAALVFFGLVMATKIVLGYERIVYYHHEIGIVAGTILLLKLLHQPVLPYLEITVLGIGIFLACGRIGCLFVGCCHGRPSRWGIRYSERHAGCGFPAHYVGVPLFPVQAVESVFVFCLVAAAIVAMWRGALPGTVLSFYVAAYAVGRFFIEFLRGDAARPFFWSFSEAQWTSAVVLWAVVLAEHWRILTASRFHLLAAVSLILCMAAIAAKRRVDRYHRFELGHPDHLGELVWAARHRSGNSFGADISESSGRSSSEVRLFTTSRGIHISRSEDGHGSETIQRFCFSRTPTALTRLEAKTLSRTVALVHDVREPLQLIEGQSGIFHLQLSSGRHFQNRRMGARGAQLFSVE
jgi:Prolipoprotein diacylglyceryl transferase